MKAIKTKTLILRLFFMKLHFCQFNPLYTLVFSVFILITFQACKNDYNIVGQQFETSTILRWKCFGPFTFDTIMLKPEETFWLNDLYIFGIDENNFQKDDLKKLPASINLFEIKDKEGSIDFMDYAGRELNNLSNYYLFGELSSIDEKDVVLVVDGSYGFKLWHNGKLVVEDVRKYNTNKLGDRFVPVTLSKGLNAFFAKVNRGTNQLSWKFNLTIANYETAQQAFFDNCLGDFIANPQNPDTLKIYTGPFIEGNIAIYDLEWNTLYSEKFIPCDIASGYISLPIDIQIIDGFYHTTLAHKEYQLQQLIYIGDMLELKEQFLTDIESMNGNNFAYSDLKAAYRRFEYCIDDLPDIMSRSNTQYKQGNNVFYAYNLFKAIEWCKEKGSLQGFEGFIIKTLYPNNKEHVKSFLFQCSGTQEEIAEKPVIIMVPYALEGDDFLTSWYLSSLDQLFVDVRLAIENGFSIVWLFMDGINYSIDNAEREIVAVVEVLKRDYSINPRNIYLNGDCVGGMRALMIASRNPDFFAGVAAHGPVTRGSEQEAPINLVRNLYNLPVCIVHGQNDKVVPIAHTKRYINTAKKFGFTPHLIEIKDKGKHSISKAYHSYSFKALKLFHAKKKNQPITRIKFCSFNKKPASIYWIDIIPDYQSNIAELVVDFDSINNVFDVNTKGVVNITIHTEQLNLNAYEIVTVIQNAKILFKGSVAELDKQSISVR